MLPEEAEKAQHKKWGDFFAEGFSPWDSGAPSSQLCRLLEDRGSEVGSRCIELGCATGASTRWLATQGRQATGIDLIEGVIEVAEAKAAEEGSTAKFLQADVFKLPDFLIGQFDFAYDAQCFHILRTVDEDAAVKAIGSLLVSGGMFFVLTGNDREPNVGPAVLSRDQLERAFVRNGEFELIEMREGRFDSTPHYATLPRLPLAWEALFRKL